MNLLTQSSQMKSGEIYRGLLVGAEETMNMSLSEVLRTARNGQISKLPSVYLRGSSIRFIALPDLLKNAPVFQKVVSQKRKMEQAQQLRQKGKFQKNIDGSMIPTYLSLSCYDPHNII